jgi:predicted RNA-binding Zn ribbon-like protein
VVTEYHVPRNLSKLANQLHVKFIAGSLCLDFVNTVGGRTADGAAIRDKLASYGDVLGWSLLAGSLDRMTIRRLAAAAARDRTRAEAVMIRAIVLREALYHILIRMLNGARPAARDMAAFGAELALARANQHLVLRAGGFVWKLSESGESLDRVLWPVSLSAADLLTSGDFAAMRLCSGHECGWLFLDTSRNRQRRWCDMRDCGNRAKVRAFRARRTA